MTKTTDNEAFVRWIQGVVGVRVDGWAGSETRKAAERILTRPENVSENPPKMNTSIPDSYWPMLSKIESNNRPYVKAATSSASGLYQFIKSTWIGEGGKWGPDMSLAFGGLTPSIDEQLMRAKTFTAKNAAALTKAGIPINRASLYASHFFGPGTAIKVISADVNSRADLIAGEAATKANPSILRNKTVGQFLTWLHGKTGDWAS